MTRNMLVGAISLVVAASGARAQTAHFDTFPEGPLATTFVDGGITFFGADNRLPNDPPDTFMIDNASANFSGSGFSPPNVLTLTGFEAGPQGGFSRIGEFKATFAGAMRSLAAMDVFYDDSHLGNSISMELLREGLVVDVETVALSGSVFSFHHFEISNAEFDTIRLVGSGPFQAGCFFGAVDNVVLEIPAPGCATVLCVSVGVWGTRRRARGVAAGS